jgi:hypothetical protein
MFEQYQRNKIKYDVSCVSDAKRKLKKQHNIHKETQAQKRERERRLRCSFDNESQKSGVLQKCKNQSFLP